MHFLLLFKYVRLHNNIDIILYYDICLLGCFVITVDSCAVDAGQTPVAPVVPSPLYHP